MVPERVPAGSAGDIHDRSPATWAVRDPAAHDRCVRAMFARIARVYDFMNHLLSLNLDRRWRRRLVARLDPDAWEVLDCCAGTGDLALACLRAGKGRLLLVSDFCPEMLALARRKGIGAVCSDRADGSAPSPRAGVPRDSALLAADAQRLPLPEAAVDAVMTAFGARNLANVRAGVAEMARVLRPGGQLLVLDFFRGDPAARGDERGPAPPLRWWLGAALPLLGRLLARDSSAYAYLPASMERFLSVGEFAAVARECGLVDIVVERQTLGVAHLVWGRAAGR